MGGKAGQPAVIEDRRPLGRVPRS